MNIIKKLLISLGIIGASAATYMGAKSVGTEKVASSNSPSIYVVTANAQAINFVNSDNSVDIFFVGVPHKAQLRNLLDPVYSGLVKSLGFPDLCYQAVASISRYGHQKNGMGYVGQQSDFPTYNDYANYGGGVLVAPFTQNFASNCTAFTSFIGEKNDIVLNIKNGNQTEHQAMLKAFNPHFVFLGGELQTSGMPAKSYVDSCNKIIPFIRNNYPNAIIVGNATVMRRGNPSSLKWNDSVSGMAVDAYSNYNQIGDAENFTTNQDSNVLRIRDYFSTQIPYEDSMFNSYFNKSSSSSMNTKQMKMSVGEFLLEDNSNSKPQYINNTITGVYGLGMLYQSFTGRNNLLNYLCWMSLSNLINNSNVPNTNYYPLQQLNNLFASGNKIGALTITNMNGVTGCIVVNGKNVTILLNNSTKTSFTPTITTDTKGIKSSYTNIREYSTDGTWNGAIKSDTIVGTSNPEIKACSFELINFTTK